MIMRTRCVIAFLGWALTALAAAAAPQAQAQAAQWYRFCPDGSVTADAAPAVIAAVLGRGVFWNQQQVTGVRVDNTAINIDYAVPGGNPSQRTQAITFARLGRIDLYYRADFQGGDRWQLTLKTKDKESINLVMATPESARQLGQAVVALAAQSGWRMGCPRYGIAMASVTPEQAAAMGRPAPDGAFVVDVMVDGPCGKSGIAAGDVIIAMNGTAVAGPLDADRVFSGAVSGSPIVVTVLHCIVDGQPRWFDRQVTVTAP